MTQVDRLLLSNPYNFLRGGAREPFFGLQRTVPSQIFSFRFFTAPQTVEKSSESSEWPKPSQIFNRIQRRVRVWWDDFCGRKPYFRSKNWRGAHGRALTSPLTSLLRPFLTSRAARKGGAFLCCGSIQIPFHIVSSACFSSDLSLLLPAVSAGHADAFNHYTA